MEQKDTSITISPGNGLFNDICRIIEGARQRVAVNVNSELTLMYWHIGERINSEILHNQRAEYGKEIVSTLSTQLLQLGDSGLQVAQYYTELPDKELLKAQLQKERAQAKLRIENKGE